MKKHSSIYFFNGIVGGVETMVFYGAFMILPAYTVTPSIPMMDELIYE
jgi:hypothetical protein